MKNFFVPYFVNRHFNQPISVGKPIKLLEINHSHGTNRETLTSFATFNRIKAYSLYNSIYCLPWTTLLNRIHPETWQKVISFEMSIINNGVCALTNLSFEIKICFNSWKQLGKSIYLNHNGQKYLIQIFCYFKESKLNTSPKVWQKELIVHLRLFLYRW